MPFLLLLFLTLVCLPDKWDRPSGPFASPGLSAALTWLGVALVVAFARGISAGVIRRLTADPAHRERALRRYGRLRTYHVFGLLGGYTVALYLFGWGWAVQSFSPAVAGEAWQGRLLPGAELLILTPFLAALVLSWVAFYDAERALHESAELSEADIERAKGLAAVGFNDQAGPVRADAPEPFWSRGAYVAFHVRQNLALVLAPLSVLLLLKALGHVLPESKEGLWPYVVTATGAALSLCVILAMPWLLRLALALTPLPAGPMRHRLEATARRLRFRCSDIMVWNTRNGVVNAMVAGVAPQVRYVILTDRLISELTPDEVEAVFGHEIGHAKHHHMIYYLGFLGISVILVATLWTVLCYWLGLGGKQTSDTVQTLAMVTMLGAYVFVVFGFLSRRCERQADVYGCRAVSCTHPDCGGHEEGTELAARGRGLCATGIRTFIEALEKVARLNGISRDRPGWLSSWQHSTIARRVEFLQDVLADRSVERRFQRRVGLVKWGLFGGLLAALGALGCYAILGGDHGPTDNAPSTAGEVDPVTPGTAEHTAPSG